MGRKSYTCANWRICAAQVCLFLFMAWSLSGCLMSHVDAARQAGDDEEQVVDEEPVDGPQGPGPEDPSPQGSDQRPAVSIADSRAAEDEGTVSFRVSLSKAAGTAISVQYATEDGTAEAGADYVSSTGVLRFPAGSSADLPIQVTVNDDALPESAETFLVRLSNVQGATLATATATGTITDNDTRALVVRPRELTVLEGRSARYEVALGSQPTGQVTVALDNGPELTVDPDELQFGTQKLACPAAGNGEGGARRGFGGGRPGAAGDRRSRRRL